MNEYSKQPISDDDAEAIVSGAAGPNHEHGDLAEIAQRLRSQLVPTRPPLIESRVFQAARSSAGIIGSSSVEGTSPPTHGAASMPTTELPTIPVLGDPNDRRGRRRRIVRRSLVAAAALVLVAAGAVGASELRSRREPVGLTAATTAVETSTPAAGDTATPVETTTGPEDDPDSRLATTFDDVDAELDAWTQCVAQHVEQQVQAALDQSDTGGLDATPDEVTEACGPVPVPDLATVEGVGVAVECSGDGDLPAIRVHIWGHGDGDTPPPDVDSLGSTLDECLMVDGGLLDEQLHEELQAWIDCVADASGSTWRIWVPGTDVDESDVGECGPFPLADEPGFPFPGSPFDEQERSDGPNGQFPWDPQHWEEERDIALAEARERLADMEHLLDDLLAEGLEPHPSSEGG